jgi:hypothetical protein
MYVQYEFLYLILTRTKLTVLEMQMNLDALVYKLTREARYLSVCCGWLI